MFNGLVIEKIRQVRNSIASMLIIVSVILLVCLGLLTLSSVGQSFTKAGDSIFYKQLIWVSLGLLGGIVGYKIDLRYIRESPWVWILFVGTYMGLVAVLIPGVGMKVNGAQRWINLGFMRLQFSEYAKLGLVILLSNYLFENQRHIKEFIRGFIIPSCMIGVMCVLILLQPDFGTAFLCGLVGCLILFTAGVRLMYLIPSIFLAITLFGVAISLDPVRLRRITSFLDVEGNKSDGSYQLWQGILGFGVGGIKGVGLGNGRQQMSFLPEAHTDFIFPIIGEELGFLFSALVVSLFFVIMLVGFWRLRKAPDLFHFSLVLGLLLLIGLQALINIGVVTGCLPTKGISLPLISYGGSNLVMVLFCVGLILNCFREWNRVTIKSTLDL